MYQKLKLKVFDQNSHNLLKVFHSKEYEIVNDYLNIDSSYFKLDITEKEWRSLVKATESYSDTNNLIGRYIVVEPITSRPPAEVAVFYFGVIDKLEEKKIKARHFLDIFNSKSVPLDSFIKASVPSKFMSNGMALGSIQMQIGHMVLAPILHGFGYNCWDGMSEWVASDAEKDGDFKVGYNQTASRLIMNQQVVPFAWEQDNDPIGPDLSQIPDEKYQQGLWTPLGGAIITSKKINTASYKEIGIKIRNLPFKTETDDTNKAITKWFQTGQYNVSNSSAIDYIKRAAIEYGVVVTPTIYYSMSKYSNITGAGDAELGKHYYMIGNYNRNYNRTTDPMNCQDYVINFNVGPFTMKANRGDNKNYINSVGLVNNSDIQTVYNISDKQVFIKRMELDFVEDIANVCYVYCSQSNDKDTYFLERVLGPDIVVFRLNDGRFYKVMSGDYADIIRTCGGEECKSIYDKWPEDWKDFDSRIPSNVKQPARSTSIVTSKSFTYDQVAHDYHPFGGPSSSTMVWGNNWLDYFGTKTVHPTYRVIDDLTKANDYYDAYHSMAASYTVSDFLQNEYKQVIAKLTSKDYFNENWAYLRVHGDVDSSWWIDTYGLVGWAVWHYAGMYACDIGHDVTVGEISGIITSDMVLHDLMENVNDYSDWKPNENIYTVGNDNARIVEGYISYGIVQFYRTIVGWGILYPGVNYPEAARIGGGYYAEYGNELWRWANFIAQCTEYGSTDYATDWADKKDAYMKKDEYDSSNIFPEDHSITKADQIYEQIWSIRDYLFGLIGEMNSMQSKAYEFVNVTLPRIKATMQKYTTDRTSPASGAAVSDGNQVYAETRYTDIENIGTDMAKEMANRLRQLDNEFKAAVEELKNGYEDDIELKVEIYINLCPFNIYSLRVGMYGNITYQGRTYEHLLLTSIEIDTSKTYVTLIFGAKRSTFYSTFNTK